MKEVTVAFKTSVPEGHEQAGLELNGSATFIACENDGEAQQILAERKFSLTKLVYEKIKSLAVQSARQTLLAPYNAKEISEDEGRARMVRSLIQSGKAKTVAEAEEKVASLFA